ncbi:MAG TPA: PEP-utilizing enzyme [Polyangiales bacterium]|jgi:pyruvate,water dikinase|nr:PEP-utilizing enzyme [Polyangiales bacterium]
MAATDTAYGKTFTPPRPGAWEIDLTHFPRPSTRFVGDVFIANFGRGFAEGTKQYGLLLDRMDYVELHGFLYGTPRPVGAPESAKGPPPKPIFKLLTWLHPEVRGRIRTAAEVVAKRAWLEDLAYWDNQVKPQAIREHLAIQNVDPRKLDDQGLAAHLQAAYTNATNGVYRHGRFTMTACLPVGDFLAHAKEWTGLPLHTLLRAVKGYSAVSNGVAGGHYEKLIKALRSDPASAALLDRGAPLEALAALRAAPGEVGAAANAWLDEVSYRIVTGYDLCDHYALELPDKLVDGLRSDLKAPNVRETQAAVEQDVAKLRDKVPDTKRALFDELLSDARAVYRVRDERDHYNDGWSTGLMRRAVLELGRRLADAGKLPSPELVIDASFEEMRALLAGKGGPSAEELKARAEWRATADSTKVPQQLGFAPSPPPPADWLPPPAARLARAIDVFLFGLFQPSEEASSGETVRGIPVNAGVYEGPARVVLGSEDFASVKQGDVLVARSTSPYFNVLLPLLGAIVTERGGALSHAAIVAREYGIPGVVGTKTALSVIKNGQRIRVDGGAGEVRILGA